MKTKELKFNINYYLEQADLYYEKYRGYYYLKIENGTICKATAAKTLFELYSFLLVRDLKEIRKELIQLELSHK